MVSSVFETTGTGKYGELHFVNNDAAAAVHGPVPLDATIKMGVCVLSPIGLPER